MSSNVGFTGNYGNIPFQYKDLENIAKYTIGSSIVENPTNPIADAGAMLATGMIFETPRIFGWVKDAKNGAGIVDTFKAEGQIIRSEMAAKTAALSNGGWKNPEIYKNAWNEQVVKSIKNLIPQGKKLEALQEAAKTSKDAKKALELYKQTAKLAETAASTPAKAAEALKSANATLAQANALAHGQVKATSFFGKIAEGIGKYTGLSKLSGAAKTFATKSPIAAKALKCIKGNAAFVAIEGGIQLFTNVIPTFQQLGPAAGVKQVAKSTVKVAASVGGWAAGAAGAAAIGTLICPGLGTLAGGLIGAAVGLVGGLIGSSIASKVADAVVGKDELEIAKEKQAAEMAKEASASPDAARQLLALAAQRMQAEGTDSEEGKIAFGSASRVADVIESQTTSPVTSTIAATTTPVNTASTSFKGLSSNPFSQEDFMNKDFMSMCAGLV